MEEPRDWCSNVSPMSMIASLPVEIFYSPTHTEKKKEKKEKSTWNYNTFVFSH